MSEPLTDEQHTAIRQRIADAVRAVPSGRYNIATIANAVLAVVQPELDRLRAELAATRDRAPLTCGASTTTGLGAVGPCTLRLGHDGPVHQDRAGARWWPSITFSDRTVED